MMDTTEIYIKMCQKARHELLGVWKAKSGDFVYSDLKKELRVLYFSDYHGDPPEEYTAGVFSMWLPRQDQIQEMCGDNWLEVMRDFWYFCSHPYDNEARTFNVTEYDSIEQLWLGYYMGKNFHKIWDDEAEDWVKA